MALLDAWDHAEFWKRRLVAPCMIYAVQSGEAVKFGKANDVWDRFATLRSSNPVEIKLLCVVPGDFEMEARFHRWLAPERIHYEWFEGPRVSEALAFMAELANKLLEAHDGGDTAPNWKGLMTWPRESLLPHGRSRKRDPAPVTVRKGAALPLSAEEREAFEARQAYEAEVKRQRNEARLLGEPNLC